MKILQLLVAGLLLSLQFLTRGLERQTSPMIGGMFLPSEACSVVAWTILITDRESGLTFLKSPARRSCLGGAMIIESVDESKLQK